MIKSILSLDSCRILRPSVDVFCIGVGRIISLRLIIERVVFALPFFSWLHCIRLRVMYALHNMVHVVQTPLDELGTSSQAEIDHYKYDAEHHF
jgi:hypothetical protein